MHTVWKGAISFGLVHVPVKMFSAVEDKDISLRYLHRACGTPLAYVRKCPTCDSEVEWEEIVRGYEYEKGRFVWLEKEELESLQSAADKEIRIVDFVSLEEIDPIFFQKTYYLGPGETGANAYQLLMEAMRQSGKIGIANVTIRAKSSLAAIRVIDGCLSMETMYYPDEIRPVAQVPNLPQAAKVNEKELEMAKLLIEQLSAPFDPDKYRDEYRHDLLDTIDKKIAGEEVKAAPAPPKANVVDLMAALQASLESLQRTDKGQGDEKNAARAKGSKRAQAKKTKGEATVS